MKLGLFFQIIAIVLSIGVLVPLTLVSIALTSIIRINRVNEKVDVLAKDVDDILENLTND